MSEKVLRIIKLNVKALCGILLFTSCCYSSVRAQRKHTVRDNVFAVLELLDLQDSVEVIEVQETYILAKPRVKDGISDNSLWNSIQTSRREKSPQWFHDNAAMSRLMGHGAYSYRQRGRPSLQAVFFFDKRDAAIPQRIKLDVDRFPPSSRCYVSSVRHFLQEQLPGLMFGKSTDQERMAGAIQRRYTNAKIRQEKQPSSLGPVPIE